MQSLLPTNGLVGSGDDTCLRRAIPFQMKWELLSNFSANLRHPDDISPVDGLTLSVADPSGWVVQTNPSNGQGRLIRLRAPSCLSDEHLADKSVAYRVGKVSALPPHEAFRIYPEADLLVCLCSPNETGKRNVHLLDMYTSGIHPLARKRKLECDLDNISTFQVNDDFVVIGGQNMSSGGDSVFYIWDWRTGKLYKYLMESFGGSVASCLGNRTVLLVEYGQLVLLKILPSAEDDVTNLDAQKTFLHLPPMTDNAQLMELNVSQPRSTASAYERPAGGPVFTPDPAHDVVVVTCTLASGMSVLAVSLQALLDFAAMDHVVQLEWETWRHNRARLVNLPTLGDGLCSQVPSVFGRRAILALTLQRWMGMSESPEQLHTRCVWKLVMLDFGDKWGWTSEAGVVAGWDGDRSAGWTLDDMALSHANTHSTYLPYRVRSIFVPREHGVAITAAQMWEDGVVLQMKQADGSERVMVVAL